MDVLAGLVSDPLKAGNSGTQPNSSPYMEACQQQIRQWGLNLTWSPCVSSRPWITIPPWYFALLVSDFCNLHEPVQSPWLSSTKMRNRCSLKKKKKEKKKEKKSRIFTSQKIYGFILTVPWGRHSILHALQRCEHLRQNLPNSSVATGWMTSIVKAMPVTWPLSKFTASHVLTKCQQTGTCCKNEHLFHPLSYRYI